MKRRNFISCIGGSIAATGLLAGHTAVAQSQKLVSDQNQTHQTNNIDLSNIRDAFPRLQKEVYLDAAGMMPLSNFSQVKWSDGYRLYSSICISLVFIEMMKTEPA